MTEHDLQSMLCFLVGMEDRPGYARAWEEVKEALNSLGWKPGPNSAIDFATGRVRIEAFHKDLAALGRDMLCSICKG